MKGEAQFDLDAVANGEGGARAKGGQNIEPWATPGIGSQENEEGLRKEIGMEEPVKQEEN